MEMLVFPFFLNEYSVDLFGFKTTLNKKIKTIKDSQTRRHET